MLRRETQLPRNPLNKTTWFNPQHDNAMRDFGVKHVTLPLVLVEIDRKLWYVTRNDPTKREYSSSGHAHDAPNTLLNNRWYNLQKLDNNHGTAPHWPRPALFDKSSGNCLWTLGCNFATAGMECGQERHTHLHPNPQMDLALMGYTSDSHKYSMFWRVVDNTKPHPCWPRANKVFSHKCHKLNPDTTSPVSFERWQFRNIRSPACS